MATITTKYSIGDTVYHAWTSVDRKQHDCPDCLGSRKWSATSPAGRQYEFGCPRCSVSFLSNNDLSLNYPAHVACAHKLTIGQVRAETDASQRVQYMCVETGIGGGSLYDEGRLFTTEEEALIVARLMAIDANKTNQDFVKLYDQSLSISDFQLSDAATKLAKDKYEAAKSRLDYVLDDIRECGTFDEVTAVIARHDEEQSANA